LREVEAIVEESTPSQGLKKEGTRSISPNLGEVLTIRRTRKKGKKGAGFLARAEDLRERKGVQERKEYQVTYE